MSDILITDDGPIRTIRMNRLEKKNALTLAMYQAMAEAIGTAATTTAIRCLLIAGGPTAFCAGNDIGDFMKAAGSGALGAPILNFLYALARCEKPIVAAVNGNAVGVGTTMLLHCDYVVAGDAAKLSTPFVGLGLVPEAASSLIAPRLMGQARAFALLVMGQPLTADEAKAAGIVNAVAAAAETDAQALAAAERIAALPPQGVLESRRLMRGSPEEIVARIDEEAEAFKVRLQSPEAQAAFMAFMSRKR
ncbi:MAG: crotonase/enoyl-CoA hydratase family protein [Pseudolabrys sp.]|nr:crotonase/enoyl-CoA hydratase family protein [Pseudolabrys sp.]MDP2294317.1 crotonase/enoyl-CoA hydratase family protein [Pseudolabrys sp.]